MNKEEIIRKKKVETLFTTLENSLRGFLSHGVVLVGAEIVVWVGLKDNKVRDAPAGGSGEG